MLIWELVLRFSSKIITLIIISLNPNLYQLPICKLNPSLPICKLIQRRASKDKGVNQNMTRFDELVFIRFKALQCCFITLSTLSYWCIHISEQGIYKVKRIVKLSMRTNEFTCIVYPSTWRENIFNCAIHYPLDPLTAQQKVNFFVWCLRFTSFDLL